MKDRWSPATKDEVQQSVAAEREQTDAAYWAKLSPLLVEPYQVSIQRFGQVEHAFVVAKRFARVVYFDDVEDIFGIATEAGGVLSEWAHFSSLPVALNELAEGR